MKARTLIEFNSEDQHRDRWLISYADLVTLLLALFIVMYAASDRDRAKQISESFNNGAGVLPGSTGEYPADEPARRFLEHPILLQSAKVRQTDRGLVISLAEAGFFASGDASLSQSSTDAIAAIADVLKDSTLPVRIEGHTDSTPISNSRYPSNWELSTARAASVLVRLSELGIGPERLSAAGYAGFQPVEDNSTVEGRARNRRVDVVVLNR
jgi:chemotaxis protein MotB